jgi:hypothetical protein
MYARHYYVAAILGTIATVGWTIQGLGNAFYYRQVSCVLIIESEEHEQDRALMATCPDLRSPYSRGPLNGKGGFCVWPIHAAF